MIHRFSETYTKKEKRREEKREDLINEGVIEVLEAKIEFAEGLTRGQQLLLRQVLDGNVVVDAEPLEGGDVLASLLEDVCNHVRPPGLLLPITLHLGALVRPLRYAQFRSILSTH